MDALVTLMQRLEQQPRWRPQHQFRQVLDCWPEVVGAAVAQQTLPLRIQQGTLYVAVASPPWAQTLQFEQLRILAKLNEQLRDPLQAVRFSTRDWFGQPKRREMVSPPDVSVLQEHPSFMPRLPAPQPQENADIKTPLGAFQHWADWHQQAARQQQTCPQCGCPCPPGELKRWSVCGICAAKAW